MKKRWLQILCFVSLVEPLYASISTMDIEDQENSYPHVLLPQGGSAVYFSPLLLSSKKISHTSEKVLPSDSKIILDTVDPQANSLALGNLASPDPIKPEMQTQEEESFVSYRTYILWLLLRIQDNFWSDLLSLIMQGQNPTNSPQQGVPISSFMLGRKPANNLASQQINGRNNPQQPNGSGKLKIEDGSKKLKIEIKVENGTEKIKEEAMEDEVVALKPAKMRNPRRLILRDLVVKSPSTSLSDKGRKLKRQQKIRHPKFARSVSFTEALPPTTKGLRKIGREIGRELKIAKKIKIDGYQAPNNILEILTPHTYGGYGGVRSLYIRESSPNSLENIKALNRFKNLKVIVVDLTALSAPLTSVASVAALVKSLPYLKPLPKMALSLSSREGQTQGFDSLFSILRKVPQQSDLALNFDTTRASTDVIQGLTRNLPTLDNLSAFSLVSKATLHFSLPCPSRVSEFEDLFEIVYKLKHLSRFKFDFSKQQSIFEEDIKRIAKYLPKSEKSPELFFDFSNNRNYQDWFKHLTQYLSQLKLLQKLTLSFKDEKRKGLIWEDQVKALGNSLSGLEQLSSLSLDLTNSKASQDGMTHMASSLSKLVNLSSFNLNLSGTWIVDNTLFLLAKMLEKFKKLSSLHFNLANLHPNRGNKTISGWGIEKLAKSLPRLNNLSSLALNLTRLSGVPNESILELVRSLATAENLSEAYLYIEPERELSPEIKREISEIIEKALKKLKPAIIKIEKHY